MAQSTAELIRRLDVELAVLRSEFDGLREQISRTELAQIRERLAVVEHTLAELKKQKEEADRRLWQFTVLFVGGLITLAINFALVFVRK